MMTKGFVFGMLITPALIGLVDVPHAAHDAEGAAEDRGPGRGGRSDRPRGGEVWRRTSRLSGSPSGARRNGRDIEEKTPEAVRRQVQASPAADAAMRQSLDVALGEVPHLAVVTLPRRPTSRQRRSR